MEKQIEEIYADIVEIFDEEYGKRNLITPQNTAEKMTAKGYRKASEVAEEIVGTAIVTIGKIITEHIEGDNSLIEAEVDIVHALAELKKKYESEKDNG